MHRAEARAPPDISRLPSWKICPLFLAASSLLLLSTSLTGEELEMVSALAAQLAQGVSLNAALISSSQKRRHYGHTYLFAKEEAGTHDLDSVYAIAQNGFVALASLDSKLESLGEALFSTAARTVDRTLLPPDQLATLKSVLAAFILRLSRFILEPPTAKVIEWLVRRFRFVIR